MPSTVNMLKNEASHLHLKADLTVVSGSKLESRSSQDARSLSRVAEPRAPALAFSSSVAQCTLCDNHADEWRCGSWHHHEPKRRKHFKSRHSKTSTHWRRLIGVAFNRLFKYHKKRDLSPLPCTSYSKRPFANRPMKRRRFLQKEGR